MNLVPTTTLTSLWLTTTEPLIWLGGAGHETRSSTSYFYDSRLRMDHPHWVLQLTLAGIGFYESDRGRVLLPPGHAFFDRIPGPFRYGYATESQRPYEHVFVTFRASAAEAWCQSIADSFGTVLRLQPRSDVESLMVSIAHRYAAGILRDRYLISAQLYQLLMTIISSLKTAQLATTSRTASALTLIEQHGHDPNFNIMNLARQLQCSREHLTRQFTQSAGVSPMEYLLQHRLRLAVRELRNSDDKLDLLARRCGFNSANYLCRVFRTRYQVTPAQFRENPALVTG